MNTTDECPPILTSKVLVELRAQANGPGQSIWSVLEDYLKLPPYHCLESLGEALRLETIDMETMHLLKPNFSFLSYTEAVQRKCLVAFGTDEDPKPICILINPFDLELQTWIETKVAIPLQWRLAHPDDLTAYFTLIEEKLRAIDGTAPSIEQQTLTLSSAEDDLSLTSIARDISPVVKLVNSSLFDAMKLGASDIHLEVGSKGLTIKYRIDGVLTQVLHVPSLEIAEQVVSRLKVMSELDISERRIPQDGRFKLSIKGREIDFRVSIMPSLFGEDVVIRILDKDSLTDQIMGLRLDHLGFDSEILSKIRNLAQKPYGLMLVTGPTGSGKTTTLYAALTEINNGQDKIVTIEDPVEYQLPGILQIPVNEKKGLTFALGLRSILRHDPDKILVGEIRDSDTAQIAIQSALTGHQVFTSVHANNVFDVLGRFIHMGVDSYSFVSALNGVLAQRLLRTVCPECSIPYQPTPEILAEADIELELFANRPLVRGKGCGNCRGTGYKGRRAIGEFLRMTDELREMIVARAPIRVIKDTAIAHGTRFLRDAALDAALNGITTLEEVNRVTTVSE